MDLDEFAKMNDTRISIQDFPSTLPSVLDLTVVP
jgi:hypothetical protein